MPLYEYECESCGARFERIQKFSDPLITVCPTCGGAVRKLLSSPAIQFKGSGFYITDYAKSGAAEKSSGEGGGGKSASDKPADKTGSAASSDSAKPAETKPAESSPKPAKPTSSE
jgi:putative FmdB family regulatory protein